MHIVKGSSVKEQIEWIDRYLHHTKNKLQKKVSFGMAPIPISGYCSVPESDGVFFKYMFPVSGRIGRVIVEPVGTLAKGMTATVTLFSGDMQKRVSIPVSKEQYVFDVDWQVSAGDKIKARFDGWGGLIEPDKDGKVKVALTEVWIAFALFANREEHDFIKEDISDEGI